MPTNNSKKGKRKNIKKEKQPKEKQKLPEKQQFSFAENMVDLISNSEPMQEQIIYPQQQPQNLEPDQKESNIKEKMNFSNGSYLVALELGKSYQIFVNQENAGKVQIKTVFQQDKININGTLMNNCILHQNVVCEMICINKQKKSVETIEVDLTQEEIKMLKQSLKGMNFNKQVLIITTTPLKIQQCQEPWKNLPQCVETADYLMILGPKNTGKSTLSDYLLNTKGQNCALLDCDIGKNSCMEGCVSLSSRGISKKIWIGQFSPLNNLQTYLRAIKYLFNYYRECWFTKKLIVNTMGYTTGLGEFLIYEIYEIIKPQAIIVLQNPHSNSNDNMRTIVRNLQNGEYISKLYMSEKAEQRFPTTTNIHYYQNNHAFSKKSPPCRFERQFQSNEVKINNIYDLLTLIRESKSPFSGRKSLFKQKRGNFEIIEQSRHGKEELEGIQTVLYRTLPPEESVDMRLIILGTMIQDTSSQNMVFSQKQTNVGGLFEVTALGFGYQGFVFSTHNTEGLIGVVSEGIDFEKRFYHLNQKQLIDLQLRMGRIKHLMVVTGGLGSKGMRNNPSKTAV